MCMSRSKRQADKVSTPKTTETGEAMAKSKCPGGSNPCNSTVMHCSGYGQCCHKNGEKEFCSCESDRIGEFCHIFKSEYEDHDNAALLGTQSVAIFSVFLGVAVITLFFVMIVLHIRNDRKYKTLRRRRHILTDDNREQNTTAGMGEANAPTTDRCFSADPELGDRQIICDQKDNVNANNEHYEPLIHFQMPEAAEAIVVVEAAAAGEAAGEAATEDTVM